MAEDRSMLKHLFSCFGAREEVQPDQIQPEPDLQATQEDSDDIHTLSDDTMDTVDTTDAIFAPAESTFTVLPNTALSNIWDRYGNGGVLSLSLYPHCASSFFSQPTEAIKAERIRLLLLLEKAASKWLDAENASTQNSLASLTEGEPEAAVPALPDVDEMAPILISKDGSLAWIFFLPAVGNGRKLTLEDGFSLLQEANVKVGVDSDVLASVFNKKPYFELCPIAWCVPPVQGQDGQTAEYFQRNFVRETVSSVTDDSDFVDYRVQNNVQAITKGAVICDILPPVEGKPGMRVDGVEIPPNPVKPAEIPIGTNTVLSDDGTKLLSTLDGFLEFNNGSFHVKDHLDIRSDVDYSTGNIDFQGDVTIHGDVRERFSVKATGNVTINGLVEAATVEAGGDVVISNGISGNGQAVIRARAVRAKYLESCTVFADTLESNYIFSSRVFCDDFIHVKGGRGAIIGSTVVAANEVKASSIGSLSGRNTEISIGTLPKVREELCENRKQLLAAQSEAEELTKRVTYLKKRLDESGRPIDNRSAAEIRSIAERLSAILQQKTALMSRQFELSALLSNLPQCRLESSTVYPGVRIVIGNAVKNVDTVMHNCIAVYNPEDGDILFR